jgi:hypothetical protein
LLCLDVWIPKEPIRLAVPDENLRDDTDQLVTTLAQQDPNEARNNVQQNPNFAKRAISLLPPADQNGTEYQSFHEAISHIEKPPEDLFVSRPSYALSKIASGRPVKLNFSKAYYFDYIDCGEMLAYETIQQTLRLNGPIDGTSDSRYWPVLNERLSLRDMAGEWNAISFRPSLAGVNVLTLFVDRKSGQASFPMMHRSKFTGTASGTLHVIPAGEFQPTTDSPTAWKEHCTLWQTVLREFSEELLLDNEAKSGGLDMVKLSQRLQMRPLVELIRSGNWKTYFLGVGLDALTLKPEILLTSVIDLPRFIEAISSFYSSDALPLANPEGKILGGPRGWGEELTARNLTQYRDASNTLPAASACIEVVQKNIQNLLGFRVEGLTN